MDESEGLEKWLVDLFSVKDQLLNSLGFVGHLESSLGIACLSLTL